MRARSPFWNPFTSQGARTWAILAAVALLLLLRLDDRMLWGDEAESALLARSIAQRGLPYTNDGRNVITLYGTRVDANADGLWIWSPWLDEYLIAASFVGLGPTPGSARLPCALVGLACVALVGQWLRRRHARADVAWAGMLALGSMELFLLHSRQARYYSLIVLGQALLLHGLQDLWEGRARGKRILAGGLLVQFYCNYIVVAANVPALLAIAWWYRRRIRLADVGAALATAGAGALPWLIYAEPWSQWTGVASEPVWGKLVGYARECHFHVLPLALLAWPLLWWRRARGDWVSGLPLFFGSFLLVASLAPSSGLRYLLPLAPVAAVWVAECVWSLHWRPWAKWLLLLALVASNGPAWATAYPFHRGHALRPSLVDLLGEITHDYADATEGIVEYLNAHAQPDDKVLSPDPAFPLIFHTKLRVVDSRFSRGGRRQLPEWILAGGVKEATDPPPVPLAERLTPRYEPIAIEVPDSPWHASIPEPDLHEYRTAATKSYFIVYRRRPSVGAGPRAR